MSFKNISLMNFSSPTITITDCQDELVVNVDAANHLNIITLPVAASCVGGGYTVTIVDNT